MDFTRAFVQFVGNCWEDFWQAHFHGSPKVRQMEEKLRFLRDKIRENMRPGTEKLVDLYADTHNYELAVYNEMGFMAGFRAAFELLRLCHNPEAVVFPSWMKHEEHFREVEEKAGDILEGKRAKAAAKLEAAS